MGLEEFLHYAQGTGVNAIVGFLGSFVAEYVPQYNDLSPKEKRIVMGVACFVVPVAALVAKYFLGYEAINRDTIWGILVAGATAFSLSQAAHLRLLG